MRVEGVAEGAHISQMHVRRRRLHPGDRHLGTAPLEHWSEPKHFEGKMTGRVLVGAYPAAEICATLAGTGPLQPATPQRISVEGVVISACIP